MSGPAVATTGRPKQVLRCSPTGNGSPLLLRGRSLSCCAPRKRKKETTHPHQVFIKEKVGMVLKIHETIHEKGFLGENRYLSKPNVLALFFNGLPSWEVEFGGNFCSFKRQQREVRNRESQVLCGTRQEERAWCTLS